MTDWFNSFGDSELGDIIINTAIYVFVYFAGGKLSNYIINVASRSFDSKAIHWSFTKKIIKSVLLIVAIIGIASKFPALDKFASTLAASSTVIVAAIGLASQESMSNIVGGLFISIFKPFAEGDRVRLVSHGIVGLIEDINLRHTIIKTVENNRIIIPNNSMNKEIVENYNFTDGRVCNFLDVKISYESDFLKAKELISNLIIEHPEHVDWRSAEDIAKNVPLANVLIRNIANEGIELRVGVWASDISCSFRLCSELRQEILESFREHNIKLYQQVIVRKNYDDTV